MFFKLTARNSRRNRKENGLFFSSLLVSIVAFYIILSLPHQDVMIFLTKMESDAVNRLMTMIPVLYCLTLFILFFLIYYASKYQLERRRHEFGVCLMMGMRRSHLFVMLLAEDLGSSFVALLFGLPASVLLSELISLITARLVGLDIIGHQVTFSPEAVLLTAAGFLAIKLIAFVLLSGKIAGQEIGSLLVESPEGTKKQKPVWIYAIAMIIGILCLITAYGMAISGFSWYKIEQMGLTVILGLAGTLLLFYGFRFLIGVFIKRGNRDRQLHVFNFRQLQENVIHRSGSMAVCSLLILAALCCFGAGVGIAHHYGKSEPHVLDYTFKVGDENVDSIRDVLSSYDLDRQFSDLFEVRTGYVRTTEKHDHVFQMDSVMTALSQLDASEDRDILTNNLSYTDYPYLISLSGYNQILEAADMEQLELGEDEAAVYIDSEFTNDERTQILNHILKDRPEVQLDGKTYHLTGTVQTTNLVTDRSITLSFALILPDQTFEYYTQGEYGVFLNGILKSTSTENTSLMKATQEMNERLDRTGLDYESYLQNMGRQLFYVVAASYLTIYLAIIFMIIANTVIGTQFLMGQRKSNRRYQTLIRIGATYDILCQSSKKQINWYFGIPIIVAAVSSLFGVRALFTGLLSSRTQSSSAEMLMISAAMILALCVIECIYIAVVKRSSSKYLLTLMEPEREE